MSDLDVSEETSVLVYVYRSEQDYVAFFVKIARSAENRSFLDVCVGFLRSQNRYRSSYRLNNGTQLDRLDVRNLLFICFLISHVFIFLSVGASGPPLPAEATLENRIGRRTTPPLNS